MKNSFPSTAHLLDTNRQIFPCLRCIVSLVSIEHVIDIFGHQQFWITLLSTNLCKIFPSFQFKIKDYPSWTQGYMSYPRFVQLHVAFHPESWISKEGDKCHQLRNAIKHFNKASMWMFCPGKEMSFDKVGNPRKSNCNPVRKHNNSKPEKYRIEFFMLANASGGRNLIHHIDIFQGIRRTSFPFF